MDSQNASYQAGQAKAQTEEKASNMMDKACCAGQAAKETVKEGGSQMQDKATSAMDSVKEATGMNK
ncbi:late embryogenesis abundant protein 2-like [Chenopodium quinoa]|uniref:late embryogenesis abundant protein 2-like n=1 Tax=Chenopodium quinoa TaxID=63459 RepID=UPI000B78E7D2|nr:late embryogenesis abundant protein 2-like [Chenopodium quinoa]